MRLSAGMGASKIATAAFLLAAVVLHLTFVTSAGALWRDEASSVQQARMADWNSIWGSLDHDSFPLLYTALLRFWSGWGSGDTGLRVFGLIAGLCLTASHLLIAWLLGLRFPVVLLALVAMDPVLISETDSVRPYGISLLLMIWTFYAIGRLTDDASRRRLISAVLVAVLSVQAAYTNAFWVAAFTLCATGIALKNGRRRGIWPLFVPGAVAALSLLPYLGPLRRSGRWTPLLHSGIDWASFLGNYLHSYSIVYPLAWGAIAALALCTCFARRRGAGEAQGIADTLHTYCVSVAIAAVVVQVGVVQLLGVPPFPRYFLPAVILAGFALEALTIRIRPQVTIPLLVCVLILSAGPTLSALRMRRSNMDGVTEALVAASPADLVIVSPWYLSAGFQRYYRASAEWITIPVMPHTVMTRYDLVRSAILDPAQEEKLAEQIHRAASRGGRIWLVSRPQPLANPAGIPRPAIPVVPDGSDYIHFMAFWQDGLRRILETSCRQDGDIAREDGGVWYEERLVLTRWAPRDSK